MKDYMDRLNAEKIKGLLEGSQLFTDIIIYESLESTNTTAKELYTQGACGGTVVMTEEQTAGRGRMDRQWLSPACKNLLFSILLIPDIKVENIYSLTLALAVAGIDAIKKISGLSSMIKWPNDVYLNNKKLAGILTEFKVRGKNPAYVILGMGINVNWNPEKEKNILFPSTSIFNETGLVTSRNRLIAEILKNLEILYNDIINERLESLKGRINSLSLLTGKEVSVDIGEKIISGTVQGIDADGGLILTGQDGDVKKILNGDVSISF